MGLLNFARQKRRNTKRPGQVGDVQAYLAATTIDCAFNIVHKLSQKGTLLNMLIIVDGADNRRGGTETKKSRDDLHLVARFRSLDTEVSHESLMKAGTT